MADPVIFRSYSTASAPGQSVAAQVQSTTSGIGHRAPVRRPLRGIVPHKNTYAQLAVVSYGGGVVSLYDQSGEGGRSSWVSPMLLQSVQFQRGERFQPYVSFGAVHYLFFGEQPVTLNASAILLDTHNFEQVRDWWANYDAYLRGTNLAERGARIVLTYCGYVVEGLMIGAGTSRDAATPHVENVTFSLAVTAIGHEGTPGDTSTVQDADTDAQRAERLVDGSIIRDAQLAVAARRASGGIKDLGGDTVSIIDRLRAAAGNVASMVSDKLTQIKEAQRAAESFLLGMNQSVPPGAEGDLIGLSSAQIKEVLETSRIDERANEALQGIEGFVAPKVYARELQQADADGRQSATLRYDEYIENRPKGPMPWATGENADQALLQVLTALEGLPTVSDILYAEASRRALLAYGNEFPGYTVENGYQASELVRRLGPATYSAIRVAATATGIDAVLATIGNGVVNLPDNGGARSFDDALSTATAQANGAAAAELSGRDMYALQLEERQRLAEMPIEHTPAEVRF